MLWGHSRNLANERYVSTSCYVMWCCVRLQWQLFSPSFIVGAHITSVSAVEVRPLGTQRVRKGSVVTSPAAIVHSIVTTLAVLPGTGIVPCFYVFYICFTIKAIILYYYELCIVFMITRFMWTWSKVARTSHYPPLILDWLAVRQNHLPHYLKEKVLMTLYH